jgi:hypothetical protein
VEYRDTIVSMVGYLSLNSDETSVPVMHISQSSQVHGVNCHLHSTQVPFT